MKYLQKSCLIKWYLKIHTDVNEFSCDQRSKTVKGNRITQQKYSIHVGVKECKSDQFGKSLPWNFCLFRHTKIIQAWRNLRVFCVKRYSERRVPFLIIKDTHKCEVICLNYVTKQSNYSTTLLNIKWFTQKGDKPLKC